MLYFGYFLLVILGFINLNVVLKVIKGNILAFNPVSLFSLVVLSQFSYQIFVILQSRCYDSYLFVQLMIVMISCQLAFNYGFHLGVKNTKSVMEIREFTYNKNFWAIIVLFSLIGLIPMFYYRTLTSVYGGLNVVLGFLRLFGLIAMIISLFSWSGLNGWKRMCIIFIFIISLYPLFYYAYFVKGSRQNLFALIYIVMFYLSLHTKYKLVLSRLFCIIFFVGSLLASSMTEIRRVNNYHEKDSKALSNIDYWGNFKQSFAPRTTVGNMDLGNCAVLVNYIEQNNYYNYGLDIWNNFIYNFVPQRIVGENFKSNLQLSSYEDRILGNKIYSLTKGITTTTGFYNAFHSFSYLGFILFGGIGFIIGVIFKRAKYSMFYLTALLLMMQSLPTTLTNDVSYISSSIELYFILLFPIWLCISTKYSIKFYGKKSNSLPDRC